MRSAAAAIAWEFRRRHRWGAIAVVAYFAFLAILRLFVVVRVDMGKDVQSFALFVAVPTSALFLYFLAVFTYGISGDIAARESIYPRRMFALPLTTNALAGWPMTFGAIAIALLWLALRFLGVWPIGYEIPIVWPALLAASLLAWTQALTWMPYPLPGMRVLVTVLWLSTIDAIVMVALHFKPREPLMLAILAPFVPLAFLVARSALARARRGDAPHWRVFSARRDATDARFSSAAHAQVWFEWRQYGRSLPAMVAILLPFQLSLLFIFKETPAIIAEVLIGVLTTPVIMAAFVGATVSSTLTPFLATRPLSNASLIAAKMKATVASTLAAWALVAVAVPIALRWSGTWATVADWQHQVNDAMGASRGIAMHLLVIALLVAATWKQLVQSLYVGMTGRETLVKASVFITLFILAVIVPIAHAIFTSRVAIAALWNAFPWILAVLACIKIGAAVWIAGRLRDDKIVSARTLLGGAITWDVAVFALYALLAWLVPTFLFRTYLLALIAILAVPLARLSAAPLALAWNRHR